MSLPPSFADVLDAFERLDVESQTQFAELLVRRLSERGRQRIAESAAEARHEFATGACSAVTAEELLREAQS